ncbi:MAG: acyl--CoA ligase [Rhodospirillaceae bacterium]|jgi:acyl-coenzyme A synthetase/AMP-(fatty) acid ligase|nr:acyl--CoA ligase [Rhodospirillaceae bacterium]MBT6118994.1 acyl--CoA ligase [Rhodospirillaceae bacterium]
MGARSRPAGAGSRTGDKPSSLAGTARAGIAPTADYVAHHAALRPSDIAVVERGRAVTYAEFHGDLRRLTAVLGGRLPAEGSTVAVEWTSLHEHLLFLLSLESLGVASFSFMKSAARTNLAYLKTVDLVICTEGSVPEENGPQLVLTERGIGDHLAREPQGPPRSAPLKPSTPVRVQHTSGTVGAPKRMIRTAEINEFRIGQYLFKEGYSRHSRFLVSRTLVIQALYGRAVACLRMGGACVGGPDDIFENVRSNGVTHLSVLPTDLAAILKHLPAGYAKPEALTVATFGGRVPLDLRERALRDFATDLIESYGTNEVGSVCTVGPDGVGSVVPGVTVEVVDEKHRPLIGKAGRVRVRSPGAVAAYESDRAATGRMFRDGWFYPGDRGVMPDPASLRLLGRDDDFVNIGGLKVDCVEFEEQLWRVVSPEDLGMTNIRGADDIDRLCVALVLGPSSTLDDIKRKIAPFFSPNLGGIVLTQVDRIPRTETGKIRREALRALLEKPK